MTFKTTQIDHAAGFGPDSLALAPIRGAREARPLARRIVLPHMAPCWHCSQRLQACTAEGNPYQSRYGISPNYKGSALAWIAEIDGHERRLHAQCAYDLGFKAERP